jgi:hypothetical protein
MNILLESDHFPCVHSLEHKALLKLYVEKSACNLTMVCIMDTDVNNVKGKAGFHVRVANHKG